MPPVSPVAPITVGATVNTIDVDALLQTLGRKVTDLSPWFTGVVDPSLSALYRQQFETRGAAFGTPWAPLSPATIEARIATRMVSTKARAAARAAAGADTPLRDTDGLFDAFTKPGAPGSVRVIDKLSMQRGVDYAPNGIPVAALMQSGFESPTMPVFDGRGDVFFVRRPGGPKFVPARPIVPTNMPAPVLAAWESQLVTFIEQGVIGEAA